jgi:hypothetical protein
MIDGEVVMSDIHSCSYYCTRPACVLAQRDELRGRLTAGARAIATLKTLGYTDEGGELWKPPLGKPQQAEPVALTVAEIEQMNAQWDYEIHGDRTRYLVRMTEKAHGIDKEQAEPVAYQDTAKPTEIVAAEDWENIDPAWHWMYRPLYTAQQAEPVVERKS